MGTITRFAAFAAGVLLGFDSFAADSNSGAYGARLDLQANVQVIGLGVGAAALARTPDVHANGSNSYGPLQQQVLGTQVGLLGTTVLSAGVLSGRTEHNSITPLTTSRGRAEGAVVNLQITPLLPLLGLSADSIEANARIVGTCGALVAQGSSELIGARVTALGGGLLNLPVNPPPNFTVGLNVLGITGVSLILNEQIVSGNANARSIEVNAVHLDVSANALLARLTGDIVIGSARAQRSCAAGDGPNLVGNKTATPNPATVGQPLVFNISAHNAGNQTASNVVLVDTLHPAFSISSVNAGPGGQCNIAAQVVTCSYASVAPGQTASASIQVVPTQAGTFSNGLNSGFDGPDADPGDDDPVIQITVNPAPLVADLGLELSANPNPATVGSDLFVLATMRNNGPDATQVSLNLGLSGQLNVVSIQPAGNGVCNGTTTLSCTWTSIPAGGSQSVNIRILPTASGSITANAALSLPAGTQDPDPSNNTATLSIAVQPPQSLANLAVIKTASPLPATVGQPLTFTLTVSNAGPSASGASVSDALPAGLTLQSATASDGGTCSGSSTVICSWNSIPAGGTRTATLVTIPSQAGTLSNSAVVSPTGGTTDPNTGDDTSTIQIQVNPAASANLSVIKTATPSPATVGQPLTFTLAVSNAGPSASGASVSDALPAGLTLQSATASDGGACSGSSTVVCSWNSIPAGGARTATLVTIPTQAGTLSNSAVVSPTGGTTDPNTGDDTSTIQIQVNPAASADLSVIKTATPSPATVGQPLTFTLTVSNAGPDATGASVSDALPAGLSLVSTTASDGGQCTGTATVVCNWSSIGAGHSRTATIVVTPTVSGTLSNTAVITPTGGATDPTTGNDQSTVTVTVNPAAVQADLGVTMTASPDPAIVGENLVYTLTVSNTGPGATAARLRDALPASMVLQSAMASDAGSCAGVSTVVCNWAAIPAGQSRMATITVRPTSTGTVANTASVQSTDGSTDPDPGNNSVTVLVQVNAGEHPATADLAVTQVATPQPAIAGGAMTLALTLSNNGPDATPASLSTAIDSSISVVAVNAAGGGSCNTTNVLSCNWPSVPASGSVSVLLSLLPSQAGAFSNTATVAPGPGVTDPDTSNNSSTTSLQVNPATAPDPQADLSVVVSALPETVTVGETLVLRVRVRNAGPDGVSATLNQSLDPGFTLINLEAPAGVQCNGTAQIGCTLSSLSNSGDATVQLTVRANRSGQIDHQATVAPMSPAKDPDLSNNSGSTQVSAQASSTPASTNLRMFMKATPLEAVVGAPVNFMLTVRNEGPDAAAGPIVVTADLPFTLNAESASAQGGGSCALSTSQVRCTWDGLADGALAKASVLARPSAAGTFRTIATVTHPNTDPEPSDNRVELVIEVDSQQGLRSDGSMCRVNRRLTDHDAASHFVNAQIRYGGADVIYGDQLGASNGAFVESLLAEGQKTPVHAHSGSDAQLLAASRHGGKAVVRSSKNLAEPGAPMDGSALFLVDLHGQSTLRLPAELMGSSLLTLDGAGDELYFLVDDGNGQSALKRFGTVDGSIQTVQTYSGAPGLFTDLKVSHSGWQLAFTARINPVGQNNDGSLEVFRFDAVSGQTWQVSAGVGSQPVLGGFDGAGDRLTWVADGQVHVHDALNGSRQVTHDLIAKQSALLSHNGTKVAYLAEAGATAGSLELLLADVDGGSPEVLTTLDVPGSGDRLLSHDGSAQTFLLASRRQLADPVNDGREHLYVIDCDAIRDGAWYNPARSGQGYAISRSSDGLAVLWYTYRADGTPTWYIASGPRLGKAWEADLLDVRYDDTDGTRTMNTVGKLTLTFDDSHNAIAHWTLHGVTRFEPIQFLEFDRRPPARDDTGVWFDPNNPGWGMSLSHQGKTRFMLTYLYDRNGQPLWIEGQTDLNAVQTPARLYFGPGLCSTSCGESAPSPVGRSVGSFNVEVTSYGELDISTDYRSDGSQPIQWLRASRRFVPLTPLSP